MDTRTEEVSQMEKIEVRVTTVLDPCPAVLIECSLCGPIAVDTDRLGHHLHAAQHLFAVHRLGAVSV